MKSSKNNRWALGLRKMQSREFARPVCLGLLLCASAGLNAHALLPHDNVDFPLSYNNNAPSAAS